MTVDPVDTMRRSVTARALIVMIRIYQAARAGRISPCRFWPTCSEYAIEAIQVHGTARGAWLAVRRLGRCRPWGGHGFDPVPEPGSGRFRLAPSVMSRQAGATQAGPGVRATQAGGPACC